MVKLNIRRTENKRGRYFVAGVRGKAKIGLGFSPEGIVTIVGVKTKKKTKFYRADKGFK